MDASNGYERVAAEFLAGRSTGVGVRAVRTWARSLPREAAVIDLGCGSGRPITEILVAEGCHVFGVDAAPSFVHAFRQNLPGVPVVCEAVENSTYFGRTFDAALAWGLMFLLGAAEQRRLIRRIAAVLIPGGRLLFTSPAEVATWTDTLTGRASRSLGADEYRARLQAAGLDVVREYEDDGENHYFDAVKRA